GKSRGLSIRLRTGNATEPWSMRIGEALQISGVIVTRTAWAVPTLEDAKPAMRRTAAARSASALTNIVLANAQADVDPRQLVEDRILGRGDEARAVQDRARSVHRLVVRRVGDGDHGQSAGEADRKRSAVAGELVREEPGGSRVDRDPAHVEEREAALRRDEPYDFTGRDE